MEEVKDLDFIKEIHDNVVVEIVMLSRATLKEAESFKELLATDIRAGWRRIVVDLSECEFIDSTFLGALVVSLKKVTSLGGDLRLVGFQQAVHAMFQLTRMYRIFETFKTKEEAVASFKQ
ncbi:MAG: STAS domain-containing protein [Ignavibacteriaceae bacterium]|jgi:anti-anti-sigma factor|nr:STAS domain-containing protein [Ignavibacteriaceae bacterium]